MIDFKRLKNRDFSYFGYRAEPFFASDLIVAGLTDPKNIKRVFQITNSIKIILVNYELFNIQPTVDAFTRELSEKIKISGQTYVNRIIKGCLSSGNNLLELSKKIYEISQLKTLNKNQLIKLLSAYQKNAYNYCVYYIIAWFEKSEKDLALEISQKYSKNEQSQRELFDLICTPSNETAAELEQDEFLKILSNLPKSSKDLEKLARQHAKKYGWLGVRYFIGKSWLTNDVLDRIKNADKKRARFLLEEQLNNRKKIEYDIKLKVKKFSKKDRNLVSQIRDVIYLRTQRADFFHGSTFYLQPLLYQISKVLKIKFEDLLNFSPDEVSKALKGTFDLKKHIIPRRINLITFFSGKGKYIEGEKATAFIRKYPVIQRRFKQINVLKGQSAFKGFLTGKAKIVTSQKDLNKVEKGDILVTTMTTPNFIAAMEKAAGFVTNEGGILCHAAIVSREMKKPCVIGTGIATKLFKDGDLVEVDANRGLVKKISKRHAIKK